MKKVLLIATLSIAVAAVIKRVTEKTNERVIGKWSKGPHIKVEGLKINPIY